MLAFLKLDVTIYLWKACIIIYQLLKMISYDIGSYLFYTNVR